MEKMEGVDLYGDLEDPFFFNDRPPHPLDQISESKTVLPGNSRVKELEQQNKMLTEQNKALRMNISCLYKTARSELDRKEAMVERLMERVKNLEATISTQQHQQQVPPTATCATDGAAALDEATLTAAAAAAYYQAQLLLFANSVQSAPGVAESGGLDYTAVTDYYNQMLGFALNDRTPTTSNAGTPLPSDGEREEDGQKEDESLDPFAGNTRSHSKMTNRSSKTEVKGCGKTERGKHRGKRGTNRRHLSPSSSSVIATKDLSDKQTEKSKDTSSLSNNGGQRDEEEPTKMCSGGLSKELEKDTGVENGLRQRLSPPAQKIDHCDGQENQIKEGENMVNSSINETNESTSKRNADIHHSPIRDPLFKEEREAERDNDRVRRSCSKDSPSSTASRSSSLHARTRSPSHDKENIRRLPSESRGQRHGEERIDVRSRRNFMLERVSRGDSFKRSRGNSVERRSRGKSVERRSRGISLERRSRGSLLERRSRGISLERESRGILLERSREISESRSRGNVMDRRSERSGEMLERRSRGNSLERRSRGNSLERRSRGNSLERRLRGNSVERRSCGNSIERKSNGDSERRRGHRRRRGEPMERRTAHSRPDMEADLSRRDNRKRKHSRTPPLPKSQQEVKHARTGSDITTGPGRCSQESTPLGCSTSAPSVSSFSLSPNFDDIMAPPTPNADEILPYCADVELCENSAVLLYDSGCGQQSLLDMSRPLTPSSKLEGEESEVESLSSKQIETNSSACGEDENSLDREEKTREHTKEMIRESSVDKEDGCLADSVTVAEKVCEEDKLVVKVEENDFEIEEGEITDSESESCGGRESQSTEVTRITDAKESKIWISGVQERRQSKTSENRRYDSFTVGKKLDSKQSSDERSRREMIRSRRSRGNLSGRERCRLSPISRPPHHLPLSERRNRHSPPSSRKRIELFRDQGRHEIRKCSVDERLSRHHSSNHTHYRRH